MNDQLGGDENRKCHKESDMYFNVVKEGKTADALSRPP